MEVDGGISGRMTQVHPAIWHRTPAVLHVHVSPIRCEGRCEAIKEPGGENRKHKGSVTAHDHYYATDLSGPHKVRTLSLGAIGSKSWHSEVETLPVRLWLRGWSIYRSLVVRTEAPL